MSIRIGPPVKTQAAFNKPGDESAKVEGELFDNLLPASWTPSSDGAATVYFPVLSIHVSIQHDVVQHKYWGVDGARVESTGRGPMEIEAVIPFFNGIFPSKVEVWEAGTLYPDAYLAFLRSFANQYSGNLVHPELGEIFCRCVSIEFTHEATSRDGVQVTAKWIESREDLDDTGLIAENASPINAAQVASSDLDASTTDLLALIPAADLPDETFTSLVNKVIGFVDSGTAQVNALLATPAQIAYTVKRLQASLDRAKDANSALAWKIREAAIKLEVAARQLAKTQTKTNLASGTKVVQVVTPGKTIAIYRNRVPNIAFASLYGTLASRGSKTTMTELLQLNPNLAARVTVGADELVRHYV